MRKLAVFGALVTVVLTGCTSITSTPLKKSYNIQKIAIKENEKVTVPRFVDIVQSEFENHGIATVVYQNKVPVNCQATMTYTALRSWDFTTYLTHAELKIRDLEGNKIAEATFHLNGKGGLALTKFDSTESKMKKTIDQLLIEYD